jgi:hypothetical protein
MTEMSDTPPDAPAADPSAPTGPAEAPRKPSLKERLTRTFEDYGKIAIYTYFTLSILTIIGFSIAIGMGFEPSDATGFLGVIFAGWVAAKATLPIRILITLAITPVVASVVNRLRPKRPEPVEPVDEEA